MGFQKKSSCICWMCYMFLSQPTLMVIVLTTKVSRLSKAPGKSVLSRTLDQIVATHLCVMVCRCSSRCCAVVGAWCVCGVVNSVVHPSSSGSGSRRRTVARHRANSQRAVAKWCCRPTEPNTHAHIRASTVHGRKPGVWTARVLAKACPAVGEPYLDTGFGEGRGLSQLFPGVDVRVLGAGKGSLECL